MPVDGKGMYRHNSQVARMHGGTEKPEEKPEASLKEEGAEGGKMTEVHNHGDGTFHTVHDGKEEQHETIGHMHAHLSKIHGESGEKHFHGHDNGLEAHTHSVETGGEPEHRDHEAGDVESMKDHLGDTMGEEGEQQSMDTSQDELSGSHALGMM